MSRLGVQEKQVRVIPGIVPPGFRRLLKAGVVVIAVGVQSCASVPPPAETVPGPVMPTASEATPADRLVLDTDDFRDDGTHDENRMDFSSLKPFPKIRVHKPGP